MALQSVRPPVAGPDTGAVPLRPAWEVMDLARLGSLHACRISFIRTLIRKLMRERWRIECRRFDLDAEGYGTAIYRVETPGHVYNLVVFAQYLDPAQRSDRVIAEAWDCAFALCVGEVDEAYLETLRANVPRQEAGRCDPRVIVLSRANRSVRNFEAVVEALADGRQPDPARLARVGYLYRTTAVYGNGKFGIADYPRIREWEDFGLPFSAQMFAVYLLRHFSIEQVEHIARCRAPGRAVAMAPALQRYLGIGNSTGLGMAPFLINHPALINQWMLMRETAIARCLGEIADATRCRELIALLTRARQHTLETWVDDTGQAARNARLADELELAGDWLAAQAAAPPANLWRRLAERARAEWGLETQELIHSLLMELYPERVDALERQMGAAEGYELEPEMPVASLLGRLERDYDWALGYDFDDPEATWLFWYRSAEKEEPRLGERGQEPGAEREMPLDIARQVRRLYDALQAWQQEHGGEAPVVEFLLAAPRFRGIVRRVQTLSALGYGEIRANLLARGTLPIHLLRCKLAFFGATKFDPRSDRWVRITLFQGAPRVADIGEPFADDGLLPLMPRLDAEASCGSR